MVTCFDRQGNRFRGFKGADANGDGIMLIPDMDTKEWIACLMDGVWVRSQTGVRYPANDWDAMQELNDYLDSCTSLEDDGNGFALYTKDMRGK